MTKPTGTNDLNSFELFVQRKKYKDSSYPLTSTTGAPTPFDLWYDKPLYGRINKKGQSLIAKEEKLKRVESAETDLFVLDFVADAFENFRNEFLFLNKENAAGTIFGELIPVKGWESSVDNREAIFEKAAYDPQHGLSKEEYDHVHHVHLWGAGLSALTPKPQNPKTPIY